LETQLQERLPTGKHEHMETRDVTHCQKGILMMADNGCEISLLLNLIVVYVHFGT